MARRCAVTGKGVQVGFAEVQFSESLAAVKAENAAALRRQSDCPWFTACRGACPHDRYTAELRLPGYESRCCGFAPCRGIAGE